MTFKPGDTVEIFAVGSGSSARIARHFFGLRCEVESHNQTDSTRTYVRPLSDRPDHGRTSFYWPSEGLRLVEATPREESAAMPTTTEATQHTQKYGPIEVGDKVVVAPAHRRAFPSSLLDVELTVASVSRSVLAVQLPDGRLRSGWLASRFEHVRVPVAAAPVLADWELALLGQDEVAPPPAPSPQVGDRVRVVAANNARSRIGQLGVIEALEPLGWDSFTPVHPYLIRFDNGETLYALTVEAAPEPAPVVAATVFAVGDRVKLLEDIGGDARIGDIGTVEEVRSNGQPTYVRFDRRRSGARGGGVHATRRGCVEFVSDPPIFAAGDQVTVLASAASDGSSQTGEYGRAYEGETFPLSARVLGPVRRPGYYSLLSSDGRAVQTVHATHLRPAVTLAAEPTPEPTPAPSASTAHQRDIELIGNYMAVQAKQGEADGGWCSAYDRIVEALNPQLTVPLRGRLQPGE